MSIIEPPQLKESIELVRFFDRGRVDTYKKNEWICGSEHGPCEYIHYIKHGYVKAYSETDKENVHVIFDDNEMFPVLQLIQAQDRRVRYGALSRVRIQSVHVDEVWEIFRSDSSFSSAFLESILRQYRVQADRIDNLEYQQAYERVAYRILFLTARFGTKNKDGFYLLDKMFTHKLIGNTINLSRESVSREIMKLQEKGLIGREDHVMVIPDIDKLAAELSCPISSNIWGLGTK